MNGLVGAVVLTKDSGFLGPIASILGWIMDLLFEFTSIFGIENIGLCIILFYTGYKGSYDSLDHKAAEIIQADDGYAAGNCSNSKEIQRKRK